MEYPYLISPSKFNDFVEQLKKASIPQKINFEYLNTLGYKSSNDRQFITILRFLNLIDSQNTPIEENYRAIRVGEDSKRLWARLIKNAYKELFDLYPNAPEESGEKIKSFFSTKTKAAEDVIRRTTNTFFNLCKLADFKKVNEISEEKEAAKNELEQIKHVLKPITINVNIQLEIPLTKDEDIYEKLFSAMAKHIIKISSSN